MEGKKTCGRSVLGTDAVHPHCYFEVDRLAIRLHDELSEVSQASKPGGGTALQEVEL
jgi:hypothetical protein